MSERENARVSMQAGRWAARGAALRWILVSVALAALVFIPAVSSCAQSRQNTPPKSAPASQTADKGLNTGIKVHGNWTIEVQDPDGKLVTHREFENSLQGDPNSPFNGNGGGLLAGMLGRVLVPGTWVVVLSYSPSGIGGDIVITESSATGSAYCSFLSLSLQGLNPLSCSNSLSLTPPTVAAGGMITGATLTLTGSGIVPQGYNTQINAVQTGLLACTASESPSACTSDANNAAIDLLTGRSLDGASGDPSPVPVTQGQTVSVTVVLSFQ